MTLIEKRKLAYAIVERFFERARNIEDDSPEGREALEMTRDHELSKVGWTFEQVMSSKQDVALFSEIMTNARSRAKKA